MNNTVITKVCVDGFCGGEPLGTVRTSRIIIAPPENPSNEALQNGPGIRMLEKAVFQGGEITFNSRDHLDVRFGPFNERRKITTISPGIRNDGSYDAARGFVKGEFCLNLRWFLNEGAQVPHMELSGHWSTNTLSGWFEAKHIVIKTLDDIFNLPDFRFRWRKDISGLLKVEKIILLKEMNFFVHKDLCGGIESFAPGEYPEAQIIWFEDRPWMCISSKMLGASVSRIPLYDAIQKKDSIKIVWKKRI